MQLKKTTRKKKKEEKEEKPEIMLETENNYQLCRRFYQSLFIGITDIFIQYIHSLEPDEIKQLTTI